MELKSSTNAAGGNQKLKITIVTPVGKWHSAHFEPTETVEAVIAATLDHFKNKLNADDPYELRRKDSEEALPRSATLVSLGVADGDVFLLIKSTVGGGK